MKLKLGATVAWLHPTGQMNGVVVEIKEKEGTVTLRFEDGSERGAIPRDDIGVQGKRSSRTSGSLGPKGIESGEEIGGV